MRRHFIVAGLSVLLVPGLFGQHEDSDELSIVGGRFTQLGDTVFIAYRLVAPDDQKVNVAITLRRGEDTVFSVTPVSVTGAIGDVRGSGDKLILWNYKSDVPPGFQFGTDYWFQFRGTLVHEGFVPQWWHYAVGGGVVAAAVLLAGSGDEDPPATGEYSLPGPPSIRPPDK
jgi:hypothetical protein